MKKTTLWISMLCLVAAVLISACGGKKNTDNGKIMAIEYTPPVIVDPISMDSVKTSQRVNWINGSYTVTIKRVPMPSLPMVVNDYGQKYVDNRVTIEIRRPDGSEFFNESFTKSAFSSLLDNDYRKNGLLADIQLEKANGRQLEFTVMMAHVLLLDGEEMPVKLIIDSQKNYKVDYDDSFDIVPGMDEMRE